MKLKVAHLIFCVLVIIANMWLSLVPEKAMWRKIINEILIIWFSCSFWNTFMKLEKKEE
jgi:amino acid permease